MRRVCYCASPLAAIVVVLVVLHLAGRVAAQKPDEAAPGAASPTPPSPPIPFDENEGWLPLADALPASPASRAAASETTGEAEPVPSPSPDDPAMQEILRIRQKLQLNPFEGTVIEQGLPQQVIELSRGAPSLPANCPDGNDDFAAALRRITVAQAPTSDAPELLTPEADASIEPYEAPVSADAELAASLRASCRALEARANDHEDVGDYDRADDLRSLAEQLRRESRRLGSPGEVAARAGGQTR